MPIFDIFVANPSCAAARRLLMETRNRERHDPFCHLGFRTLTKSYRSAHDLNGEDIKVRLIPNARSAAMTTKQCAPASDQGGRSAQGVGFVAPGVPPLTA